jgi:subfamily B ATP-binding cassette protein MsbA
MSGAVMTARSAAVAGVRAASSAPLVAILLLVTTVAQGALQGGLVWALQRVLIGFSSAGRVSWFTLVVSAFSIFAIWLLRAGATAYGEVLGVRLAHHAEITTMHRVLAKLLTMSARFFDRSSQGDVVMAAYNDLKGIRSVTLDMCSGALHLARVLGLAVVAWVMSPMLAMLGFVLVPLALLPAQYFGQRITIAARQERATLTGLFDSFLQVATGIRVIKVTQGEGRIRQRARETGEQLIRVVMRQTRGKAFARLLFEGVSGLGLVLVLVLGGRDVASGVLPWQSLLSLVVAVVAVYTPMLGLLQIYANIHTVMPHLERVETLLQTVPDVVDRPDARRLLAAPRTFTLDAVGFDYGDRGVLRDVSATFHGGETIGIVGPSGAGKTTLVSLLLRLYDPTSGRILFDGVDLRDVRHSDLMALCAIVPQEPFLFLDSIANNIRIARPEATMEEVVEAARAANIHDEILLMERGYEGVVGRREDAHGVSVGQKQRICIAAALLKNAPILVLDEATSNLDSVSERAVQSAIDRLMQGRTTFVIAHRLSTLRRVDRILVLDEGRVVALGTHLELLASCPIYQRLWHYQTTHDDQLDGAGEDGFEPVGVALAGNGAAESPADITDGAVLANALREDA